MAKSTVMEIYFDTPTQQKNPQIERISRKIRQLERITPEEAELLFREAPLFLLSELALFKKRQISGNEIFYNKNFHIEPTNICCYHCKFCSFRKGKSDPQAWNMSREEVRRHVREHFRPGMTEVHLVGGVHPEHSLEHYAALIAMIKEMLPGITVKGFSAVEHIHMIEKAGMDYETGIDFLLEHGLDTITGGGAEIFAEEIRDKICPDKPDAEAWLALHETLHRKGIRTAATMLYGHIESVSHRIDHLNRLRTLQDRHEGFSSFIPLKYRSKNNELSHIGECSIIDDLRTLAVSRLFLDNVPHIKAYWPMYGKQTTQIALSFGADDIDGTVEDTTKIYSMAGVNDRAMNEGQLRAMIEESGFVPIIRDTFYNKVEG